MTQDEFYFWCIDQEINRRGIAVDIKGINASMEIMDQVFNKYVTECVNLTGLEPSQGEALRGWLADQGVRLPNLRADTVKKALGQNFKYELDTSLDDDEEMAELEEIEAGQKLPENARRALEIRALTASASVKKVYAMANRVTRGGRVKNLIMHHGARTGRPTGVGPQPLNLPKAGPDLRWCKSEECLKPFSAAHERCPWCGSGIITDIKKWSHEAVDAAIELMCHNSLELIEFFFGDPLLTISGSVRGMYCAGPGMELIASDYSSIEAVVLAEMAGEQWRIDAFRDNKPIYFMSASKITGETLEWYLEYKEKNGDNHEDRQKIGKVAELASGYGGWIGSWRAFGSTETDVWIKKNILAWRSASPAIPEFWGGQFRGSPWDSGSYQEFYGCEGMAIQAALYPAQAFMFRGLTFYMAERHTGPALIIRLPSKQELTYHNFRLIPADRPYSRDGEWSCFYDTWNSNPKYGPMGWGPMSTYGGRLVENIIQAISHDILRYAIVNLRSHGYPTVLHVYDEIVGEIPAGAGSVEQFEGLMNKMPAWAEGWPIRANGGWRGVRYRKG
jgi:DNA polymerase